MSNSVYPDETAGSIRCLQKPIIIACDSERVKVPRAATLVWVLGDLIRLADFLPFITKVVRRSIRATYTFISVDSYLEISTYYLEIST